jgi:hypothetical protein
LLLALKTASIQGITIAAAAITTAVAAVVARISGNSSS